MRDEAFMCKPTVAAGKMLNLAGSHSMNITSYHGLVEDVGTLALN